MNSVASIIAEQLGRGTLFMLGAMNLLAGDKDLTMKIRGSRTVSHIKIELAADDTYTMTFLKVAPRTLKITTVATVEDVHAAEMHRTIEANTGLRARL